ncbi:peptidylprolyl isomerase [Sphingomonas jatrophae]
MFGRRGPARAVALLSAVALGAAVAAQTVDDGPTNSAAGLNLPAELQVFGKVDPLVRKATAIVNGTIITDTDVDQRLALILLANGNKISDEERERVRLQVLRNLIDETLQIQEAKANKIEITSGEIEQAYARVSTNFKRQPAEFAAYLKTVGSSENSIKRQIEGELAWRRLLGRRVEPFVAVGEDEVRAILNRLEAAKGTQEYRVGEIFLAATPENDAQVRANADRIVEQVRGGASFVAYARQFSEASTAAVGGDLGWVRAELLPEPLAATVRQMPAGAVSAPIQLPGGYSIVALVDKRQILTADPRDAVLSLKQLTISFPPGLTQKQAEPKVAAFGAALQKISGCGTADQVAKSVGADVIDNDQVRIRDLPPQLQEVMLRLQIGQASPAFGSLQEGVRGLVLCGKDEAQQASGPTFDQVYSQLEEEKVNRRAQRYLRDLRRDAVVDYR